MAAPDHPAPAGRIALLDAARGTALIAMAVYHFTWDLEFFGYLPPGLTGEGGWRLFARTIASSFLFLAGISLVLAHGSGVRWRPLLRRLAEVAAAAALITLATYFATPESFVFFGILHQIALASILAPPFLRVPVIVTAAAAVAVTLVGLSIETATTNPRLLAWIGLAESPPRSNDLVPLFPWFGAVLFGVAAGRWAWDHGLFGRLRSLALPGRAGAPLAWLGRHSLAVYLLHQPILIALVWCLSQVVPPDPATGVRAECRRSCSATEDEAFCTRYCGCVVARLQSEELLDRLRDGLEGADDRERVQAIVGQCSSAPGG